MKVGYRHLAYLVLAATLVVPVTLSTVAIAQDDQHHDDTKRADQKRVYDRSHKDYHNWNDNEDRAYRQYLQDNHKPYRDYSKMNHAGQDQYWQWRHDHPDDQDKH